MFECLSNSVIGVDLWSHLFFRLLIQSIFIQFHFRINRIYCMWFFFQSRFPHLSHTHTRQLIASLSTTMQLTEVLKWTFRMRLLFVFVIKYLLCIDKSNGGCVTLVLRSRSFSQTCEWGDKRNEKSTIDCVGWGCGVWREIEVVESGKIECEDSILYPSQREHPAIKLIEWILYECHTTI